jgi:3-oxoacyl-[acyl-carrier protein] reductase
MAAKTVLITGSSKGLGRSLALVFAENKFNIILHGRDEQGLEYVKKRVLENNVDCDVIRGDITSEETIHKLFKAAEKRSLDILINNAGTYMRKPFQNMNAEEFNRIIDVNLIAPVQLIMKIYPIFIKKKSGVIININSVAGKNPNEMEAVYCASKHGLLGFSRSFQFEANRNHVRLISVYLGAMNTSMTENRIDHQKLIQPDEAADLIFRLCRDYQTLRINEIDLGRRRC